MAVVTGSMLLTVLPQKSEAKGGKMGGTNADPKDKAKLEEAAAVIQGLEEKLKDESKWGEIAEIVSKEPFTKDSMDKMFSLAAKSLPSNIQKIYGGDGGQWVGLKNEAVDAMDAFAAEIAYLEGERKKGKPVGDAADLKQYFATTRDKTKDFLALYSNTELNSVLKGGGYCAYSSSAKCDEFDNSVDVKKAVKAGGIYNELRLGK